MDQHLSFEDFLQALEAARQPRGSAKHPFSAAWANGELSRQQLGQWALQHFYYIDAVPMQFAALYSRLPDVEGRLLLLENLVGEDMPEEPEKSHPRLLLKFAGACGLDAEAVKSAETSGCILPGTRAMRAWIWELAKVRSLAEACAGIMVALEGQLPQLYPPYIRAMERMGYSHDELEFFRVHVENDAEHAEVGHQLCYKYAASPMQQQLAIAAVSSAASMRYAMLDGIQEMLMA